MSSRCLACNYEIVHARLDYDVSLTCPACSSPMTVVGSNGVYQPDVPPALATVDSDWLKLVHALWKELHEFAFVATEDQWSNCERWFADWLERVPQFGCDCQLHFRDLIKGLPPDFSSRNAFVRWSIAAHNMVNARLGKSIMNDEEALNLYWRR